MSGDLRVLEQLGREIERVAGQRSAPPRRGRALFGGRLGAVALAVALLTAAVATAAVLLVREGSPLPGAHPQDLGQSGIPLAGSARLAGLDAPDPQPGSPPWDLRLSRTGTGELCTAVGQVADGAFGILGLDGIFRPLPLGGADVCGAVSHDVPVLAGAREFLGRTPAQARTVVSGVAGADARSVTAYGPGDPRRLRLGPQGSFVTVYAGTPEDVRPSVVVAFAGGRRRAISFERSSPGEVPDPGGGAPWVATSEVDLQANAYPDENCAQVMQEPSQEDPSMGMRPLTPSVCGRLGDQPLLVSMRRFSPGSGQGSPFPWGDGPTRTLVYGIADPRVGTLVLSGSGVAKPLPIDRSAGGTFLAVLDGHVDPRSLTLTARLRDSSTRVYSHSTALLDSQTNKPLREPPVPPYREPASPGRPSFPALELPIGSSARETLHASDPVDGRTWVLRSWRGRPNPRLPGQRAHSDDLMCVALGVLEHGRLVQAGARPSLDSPSVTPEQGRCDQPGDLARMRYLLQMESFVQDPYAYAPKPGRVVLSGLLPPGASHATLLGLGAPRRLPLDSNGAFLVVAPGRYWQASPHIVYTLHGRRVGRGAPPATFPLGDAPRTPQTRAPDPDGAAPWGFAATRDCSTAIGRVVEGRFAILDEQSGDLRTGPSMTGASASCLLHRGSTPFAPRSQGPVEFDAQETDTYPSAPGAARSALSRPEVERRISSRRTLITGVALPEVSSVTIQTPSDVRTLRPSGPLHTILAVYEGVFLRGQITATVTLRDGHVKTEGVMIPGAALATSSSPFPSAQDRMAAVRRQLAEARSSLARYRAAGDDRSIRSTLRFLQMLDGYARVAERRLAYERAHPGVLPVG